MTGCIISELKAKVTGVCSIRQGKGSHRATFFYRFRQRFFIVFKIRKTPKTKIIPEWCCFHDPRTPSLVVPQSNEWFANKNIISGTRWDNSSKNWTLENTPRKGRVLGRRWSSLGSVQAMKSCSRNVALDQLTSYNFD